MCADKKHKKSHPLMIIPVIGFFVLVFVGLTYVVMWLWNMILPEVAGIKTLTFWQAAGILVLAKILFGGFKFNSSFKYRRGKKNWQKKWMNMEPEHKEEFKNKWKEHCNQRKEENE